MVQIVLEQVEMVLAATVRVALVRVEMVLAEQVLAVTEARAGVGVLEDCFVLAPPEHWSA